MYTATNVAIFQSLIAAKRRGLDVQIVADAYCSTLPGSQIHTAAAAGIPTWIDAHEKIQHNKVLVLDGSITFTGSFNLSTPAETRNAENLLRIEDSHVASLYEANFNFHKSHSTQLQTKTTGASSLYRPCSLPCPNCHGGVCPTPLAIPSLVLPIVALTCIDQSVPTSTRLAYRRHGLIRRLIARWRANHPR